MAGFRFFCYHCGLEKICEKEPEPERICFICKADGIKTKEQSDNLKEGKEESHVKKVMQGSKAEFEI